jgi:hypothetical protein
VEKLNLSQQDLMFLRDAVHSHKRGEIDKLIQLRETITTDELIIMRRTIEDQCREMTVKLMDMMERLNNNVSLDVMKEAREIEKNRGW